MSEKKYTDQEIVTGIKAKNAVYFNHFYDRYAPVFFGEIKRTLVSEELAVEVMVLAFRKIWAGITGHDEKQPLFIWALNIIQKETSRKKMELVLGELFYCQKMPVEKSFG